MTKYIAMIVLSGLVSLSCGSGWAAVDAAGRPIAGTDTSTPTSTPSTVLPATSAPVTPPSTVAPPVATPSPAITSTTVVPIKPAPVAIPSPPSTTGSIDTEPAATGADENSRLDYVQQNSQLLAPRQGRDELVLFDAEKNAAPDSYVASELVLISADMAQAKQAAGELQSWRARVVRRRVLPQLGLVISVFRLSGDEDTQETARQILEQMPDLELALNHYYRAQNSPDKQPNQAFYQAVAAPTRLHCRRPLRLGLLDGPINDKHVSLNATQITQQRFVGRRHAIASARHASAIASLWLGNGRDDAPDGLVPDAHVYNGIVMEAGEQGLASMENLIVGLDWLLQQKVDVINLSLAGPDNRLLRRAIERSTPHSVVVAAAGNSANNIPLYPAAYPAVVAVAAVDARLRLAEDATHGDFVDLVAPGVDLWLADADGGYRYMSGSSMASPWVAAAVALAGLADKQLTTLFQHAQDLGTKGKDPHFGWGLLRFLPSGNCH